jgi:hypothetical protein
MGASVGFSAAGASVGSAAGGASVGAGPPHATNIAIVSVKTTIKLNSFFISISPYRIFLGNKPNNSYSLIYIWVSFSI